MLKTYLGVSFVVAAFAAATPALAASSPKDDCSDLKAAFDKAVAAKSYEGEKKAFDAISEDIVCGARADEFIHTYIDATIDLLGDPNVPPADQQKAMDYVVKILPISGTWRNAERLGDYFADRHDNSNAMIWYDKGLSFLSSRPAEKATPEEIRVLKTRSGGAKQLASNDDGGKRKVTPPAPTRDLDGHLAGIYQRDRSVGVETVPLPINFYTDKDVFTENGQKAIDELVEAAKEQHVHTMTLIGHTDPSGEHDYNMILSKRRAEAVRKYLLAHDIAAKITVDGKGPDQPFDATLLGHPVTQDEAWALDRRVEWVRDAATE